MKELQAIVRALRTPGQNEAVLATLVRVEGSSYRRPGARLLMLPDGSRIGSISGGCLEEDVLARAQRVLKTGRAEAVVYDTTSENDLVWGVGLGCHGVVRVLVEKLSAPPEWAAVLAENFRLRQPTTLSVVHSDPDPDRLGTRLADATRAPRNPETFVESIAPPTALTVFGAGDDAQPLVRLAKEFGWHVTVADPRASFATPARFPGADALVVAPANELVRRVSLDSDGLAVVMTHHYIHDLPIIGDLLQRPLAYVGLLGPRKRANKILDDLTAGGWKLPEDHRQRLHAPVGLDIGADAPEQVALSIIAEMHAVLTRRDARPLRERSMPIHA